MRGQQVGRKAVAQGVPSSIRPFLIPAASAAFYPILPMTLGKHAPAWGAIACRRVRWRAATECSVFDHSIAALVGKNAAIALDQRRKGNPSSDPSLGVTGKASS